MDGNTIPVGENTTVVVKASGDLFLRGEERAEVRFQSSEERIRAHQSNDTLYIETHASMDIEVPRRANIVIEKVGGSAFLQDLSGSLTVQKVGGDLALQRMGTARVEKVGGSCLVEGVSDILFLGKVGGDLTVRQAAGRVEVGSIGGNGDIQAVGLGTMQAKAGGDLRLYITDGLEGNISLRAGSDIEMFLSSNLNSRFILNSSGETIVLNLTRQDQPPVYQSIDERRHEFVVGAGDAVIEAYAGGDIRVSDEAMEPESISAELQQREDAWLKARERHGNPAWSAGFGFDRASAWADMVSRRAQEASRRAEQHAQSAMRRTEEQIRQAADREIHRAAGFPFAPPVPPVPPASVPPAEPVTEQERLMVLQMLQDKKISIEQAEKLLAALEGRQSR